MALSNIPPRMSNELIGPNDYVDSRLLWANDGVDAVRQSHCDRWDNRKMVVDLLDPNIHKSGYTGPGYRYQTVPVSGAMVQDMSPAFAHIWGDSAGTRGPTNAGNGEIEFGYVGDGTYSDANLRSVTCNDGDSKLTGPGVPASGWITQSQLKANPGLVSKINAVRMLDVVIPPGKTFQLFVHMHTLSTNPVTGAVWPDGTIIPNYGAYQISTSTSGSLPGTARWASSARAAMGNDPLALLTSTSSANPLCSAAGRYCDDGYSDRLRLATETVGVRKGVLGTDPTGGPNSDNPSIPRFRGDFVTYQLWPTLTAKSPGVQINNDLILVDTLPPGTRFVPGSLTFGGVPVPATDYVLVDGSATFGASKLAIRIPNQLAEANPVARIPAVEFQAELMLADPNNTVSRQLVNSVEIQACMPSASINADATYNCNVQTASQQLSERTSTRTISLAASGALVVQKAVVGSISQQIGSKFTMALNYLNAGSNMVPDHRLIDVLPRVGEADRGFPDLAADATSFSGVRRLLEVRTPLPTGYVVYYTTAAPASINVNPKCPSNWGVGNWPQFAPGVPPSAGSCPVTGTTTWVAANQSGAVWSGFPVGTTAILVKDLNAFASGAPMRSVQLDFDTPGSRDGDRYANNFSGAHGGPGTQLNTPGDPSSGNGPGATFDAYSNNVTVRVVAASLSGTVFEDPNRNGSAGFEPGVDTGLPGVVVALTQGGLPIGTATTALADIPAGQFYNPATGGASATPGPGLCPVPATGLAMGQYLFCDLLAGSGYQVVETQPSGYTTTSNAAGSAGGAADAATDTTSGITLGVGQRATGYDFGESTATTVSGRVYVESNGNQVDDGPTIDPGLVTTVSISCVGPAGAPNYTNSMQTGADGTYSFSGMAPWAECTITETQPTGHNNAYTQPGASGNPSTVGPVDPQGAGSTTDSKITITVPPAGSPNNNFAETMGSGGNVSSVPTLNQWSLLLLATLLSGLALRRRSRVS